MGGRADLHRTEDRPLYLLRHQGQTALGQGHPRRHHRTRAPDPLGEELLRLRPQEALEGGPTAGDGDRAGPGGPAHAPTGHSGRHPGQEALHHQVRSRPRPRSGPRQPELHCSTARCPVGGRLHLLLHLVGCRLRGLHHRRPLPEAGRLEGGTLHDHRPRPRRSQHGCLDPPPHQPRRTHLSHGRGIAR